MPSDTLGRMKRFARWIIPFIFILHIALHVHNYAIQPPRGETSDEYTYAFLGLSLIQKGIPTSWSLFLPYQNVTPLTIRGIFFPIVSPYFDHPPLYGLLIGGWSWLYGERTFESVNLATIRLIPIVLSVVTLSLILKLGRLLFDEGTTRWAMLIFATAPLYVLNTRVVFAENLLTVFLLSALLFYRRKHRRMNFRAAGMLGLVSALSLWTKISGIAVGVGVVALGILDKIQPKYLMRIALYVLLAAVLYVAYGALYNLDLFLKINNAQATRPIGPETLTVLLTNPVIVNKVTIEGWYGFGLFALAILGITDFRRNRILLIPALIYLLFLLATLTKEGSSGWYMIPLYPFMAIASAKILRDGIAKGGWILVPFLLLVFIPYITRFEALYGLTIVRYRLILAIIFLPVLTVLLLQKNTLTRKFGQALFALSIIANTIVTYTYVQPV